MFDMGAYGFYVWSSVLLGMAVYAWNLLAPALGRRAVMQQLDDPEADEEQGA
jgi:heme exporter protein CcmD